MKLFLKLNDPPPADIVYAGETSSVSPTVAGSGANAAFGAVSGVVVDVTHGTSAPVAVLVHPAGSAGAVTPSKFSVKTTLKAEQFGVGVFVAVPVAVAVGVFVAVAVGGGGWTARHTPANDPVSPVTLSPTYMVQFPPGDWPLKAAKVPGAAVSEAGRYEHLPSS